MEAEGVDVGAIGNQTDSLRGASQGKADRRNRLAACHQPLAEGLRALGGITYGDAFRAYSRPMNMGTKRRAVNMTDVCVRTHTGCYNMAGLAGGLRAIDATLAALAKRSPGRRHVGRSMDSRRIVGC
jgi:hypothetical protein